MSISEELARLNELHQSGALTSEEYSGAKTKLLGDSLPESQAAVSPKPNPGTKQGGPIFGRSNPIRLALLVALLAVVIWAIVRNATPSQVASNPVLSAVASLRPVDIRDEVQNLPASSIKWVPLTLPYAGTLHLEAQVVRGNPLDVRLVDPTELESIKAKKPFRQYAGFEAERTTTYKRDGRLQSGTYMLVLVDQSLGIMSASSSDVRLKARLVP